MKKTEVPAKKTDCVNNLFMNDSLRPEVIKHQELSGDYLHELVTAGFPSPKDSSVELTFMEFTRIYLITNFLHSAFQGKIFKISPFVCKH